MKKLFVLVISMSLLFTPILAQSVQTDACMQAQAAADRDINTTLWFGAGCLFGIFGLGAAYVVEPSPSATSLLGKSPEYVAVYTDCYRDGAQKIQQSKAMTGCLVGTGVQVVAWVLLSAATATAYTY